MDRPTFESRFRGPEPKSRAAKIVVYGLAALVFLMGAAAFTSGAGLLMRGDPNRAGAVTAVVMGLGLAVGSLAFFYWSLVSEPIARARLERVRRLHPGQPWMERADWASRRLEHTTAGPTLFLWIWTVGWWGFLIIIGTVNADKIAAALRSSWWNVALMSLFMIAGLVGLMLALHFTWSTWRYGTSVLRLDTFPVVPGEPFVGTLTARLQPLPRHPLYVTLVCEDVEWVETGHGKNRSTRAVVRPLGRTEAIADPRRFIPGRVGASGRIEIAVREGLPDAHIDERGNGIRWRLTVATTGDDPSFSCEFDLPVFTRKP